MTKKDGVPAVVYGVTVAVEHNPDGSVTICKELVDDILADAETPEFVRRVLTAGIKPNRFGDPVVIHKVE